MMVVDSLFSINPMHNFSGLTIIWHCNEMHLMDLEFLRARGSCEEQKVETRGEEPDLIGEILVRIYNKREKVCLLPFEGSAFDNV